MSKRFRYPAQRTHVRHHWRADLLRSENESLGASVGLHHILQSLGPMFRLFGRYLSTRFDLLPHDVRSSLAQIPDTGASLPFAQVSGFVSDQLGHPWHEIFREVSSQPSDVRILYSSYAAILHRGEEVTIRVLRSELADGFAISPGYFGSRYHPSAFEPWTHCFSSTVLADFNNELRQRTDFLNQAETMDSLLQDARDQRGFWFTGTHRDLSRSGILVTGRNRLPTLRMTVHGFPRRNPDQFGSEPAPSILAKLLMREWILLALFGSRVPVCQTLDDIVLDNNGQLAWFDGAFAMIPSSAKDDLWKYLLAAATDNPDECCMQLQRLMQSTVSRSESDLLSAFRQVVAFPQLEPDLLQSELALRILRHYQVMSSAGYQPLEPILCFYRGLFSTLLLAQELSAGTDPLPQAVEEAWVMAILAPLRKASNLEFFVKTAASYACSMMELPQQIERFLDRNDSPHSEYQAQVRYGANSNQRSLSLLLLLAAGLVLINITGLVPSPKWKDLIGFVICFSMGAIAFSIVKTG